MSDWQDKVALAEYLKSRKINEDDDNINDPLYSPRLGSSVSSFNLSSKLDNKDDKLELNDLIETIKNDQKNYNNNAKNNENYPLVSPINTSTFQDQSLTPPLSTSSNLPKPSTSLFSPSIHPNLVQIDPLSSSSLSHSNNIDGLSEVDSIGMSALLRASLRDKENLKLQIKVLEENKKFDIKKYKLIFLLLFYTTNIKNYLYYYSFYSYYSSYYQINLYASNRFNSELSNSQKSPLLVQHLKKKGKLDDGLPSLLYIIYEKYFMKWKLKTLHLNKINKKFKLLNKIIKKKLLKLLFIFFNKLKKINKNFIIINKFNNKIKKYLLLNYFNKLKNKFFIVIKKNILLKNFILKLFHIINYKKIKKYFFIYKNNVSKYYFTFPLIRNESSLSTSNSSLISISSQLSSKNFLEYNNIYVNKLKILFLIKKKYNLKYYFDIYKENISLINIKIQKLNNIIKKIKIRQLNYFYKKLKFNIFHYYNLMNKFFNLYKKKIISINFNKLKFNLLLIELDKKNVEKSKIILTLEENENKIKNLLNNCNYNNELIIKKDDEINQLNSKLSLKNNLIDNFNIILNKKKDYFYYYIIKKIINYYNIFYYKKFFFNLLLNYYYKKFIFSSNISKSENNTNNSTNNKLFLKFNLNHLKKLLKNKIISTYNSNISSYIIDSVSSHTSSSDSDSLNSKFSILTSSLINYNCLNYITNKNLDNNSDSEYEYDKLYTSNSFLSFLLPLSTNLLSKPSIHISLNSFNTLIIYKFYRIISKFIKNQLYFMLNKIKRYFNIFKINIYERKDIRSFVKKNKLNNVLFELNKKQLLSKYYMMWKHNIKYERINSSYSELYNKYMMLINYSDKKIKKKNNIIKKNAKKILIKKNSLNKVIIKNNQYKKKYLNEKIKCTNLLNQNTLLINELNNEKLLNEATKLSHKDELNQVLADEKENFQQILIDMQMNTSLQIKHLEEKNSILQEELYENKKLLNDINSEFSKCKKLLNEKEEEIQSFDLKMKKSFEIVETTETSNLNLLIEISNYKKLIDELNNKLIQEKENFNIKLNNKKFSYNSKLNDLKNSYELKYNELQLNYNDNLQKEVEKFNFLIKENNEKNEKLGNDIFNNKLNQYKKLLDNKQKIFNNKIKKINLINKKNRDELISKFNEKINHLNSDYKEIELNCIKFQENNYYLIELNKNYKQKLIYNIFNRLYKKNCIFYYKKFFNLLKFNYSNYIIQFSIPKFNKNINLLSNPLLIYNNEKNNSLSFKLNLNALNNFNKITNNSLLFKNNITNDSISNFANNSINETRLNDFFTSFSPSSSLQLNYFESTNTLRIDGLNSSKSKSSSFNTLNMINFVYDNESNNLIIKVSNEKTQLYNNKYMNLYYYQKYLNLLIKYVSNFKKIKKNLLNYNRKLEMKQIKFYYNKWNNLTKKTKLLLKLINKKIKFIIKYYFNKFKSYNSIIKFNNFNSNLNNKLFNIINNKNIKLKYFNYMKILFKNSLAKKHSIKIIEKKNNNKFKKLKIYYDLMNKINLMKSINNKLYSNSNLLLYCKNYSLFFFYYLYHLQSILHQYKISIQFYYINNSFTTESNEKLFYTFSNSLLSNYLSPNNINNFNFEDNNFLFNKFTQNLENNLVYLNNNRKNFVNYCSKSNNVLLLSSNLYTNSLNVLKKSKKLNLNTENDEQINYNINDDINNYKYFKQINNNLLLTKNYDKDDSIFLIPLPSFSSFSSSISLSADQIFNCGNNLAQKELAPSSLVMQLSFHHFPYKIYDLENKITNNNSNLMLNSRENIINLNNLSTSDVKFNDPLFSLLNYIENLLESLNIDQEILKRFIFLLIQFNHVYYHTYLNDIKNNKIHSQISSKLLKNIEENINFDLFSNTSINKCFLSYDDFSYSLISLRNIGNTINNYENLIISLNDRLHDKNISLKKANELIFEMKHNLEANNELLSIKNVENDNLLKINEDLKLKNNELLVKIKLLCNKIYQYEDHSENVKEFHSNLINSIG